MAEETLKGCLMFLRNPSSISRRGYKSLDFDGYDHCTSDEPAVTTVVVGKEKRVFLVEPAVLKKDPFRILMGMMGKEGEKKKRRVSEFESFDGREVIFVDVDAILFEHMLWLVKKDDCSSMFQLDFEEIIEFYAQD